MTVRQIVSEPLRIHGIERDERAIEKRVIEILDVMGLKQGDLDKFPHEFSGGQVRRIGIARALILRPEFMVADEPVSGLDVSVAAGILNLVHDLRDEFHLTYLWISHDLHAVSFVSDRVAVMYLGTIVEVAKTRELIRRLCNPLHPRPLLGGTHDRSRASHVEDPPGGGNPQRAAPSFRLQVSHAVRQAHAEVQRGRAAPGRDRTGPPGEMLPVSVGRSSPHASPPHLPGPAGVSTLRVTMDGPRTCLARGGTRDGEGQGEAKGVDLRRRRRGHDSRQVHGGGRAGCSDRGLRAL
jgi:hypothetical protein